MSVAGRRSNEGDEYQLCVALHWLIQLLEDDSICAIQVDSTGVPGQSFSVTVDDIVVLYNSGFARFIQAKKNQPKHGAWSLSDQELQKELIKARNQLESCDDSIVEFYSRSPFGALKALAEECNRFPDFLAFQRDAPKNQSNSLKRLAKILERSHETTFNLVQRFNFGPTYEFDDWDRENNKNLERLVPNASLAKLVLERYLGSHEACLRDARPLITREDVWAALEEKGLSPTPRRSEIEILATFKDASKIGRHWLCTVDGKKIPRVELNQLLGLIEQGSRTILLTDRPGSGKTCLLLDLADQLETGESPYGLLFIKGDQFTGIDCEQDLVDRGLPEDIVGQCARLAGFRRVVVVIDSLDVLSLSRQHSALKVLLGLMDRLERIEWVTVIAACRNFDLQYDPLLRGRSWQQTVHLQPFDFETVVKPFLICWEIDPSSLSTELRQLLQIPQHLRIYGKLAKLGKGLSPTSAYELYDSFIEEVVVRNPLLGDQAMVALQGMADHLMQKRSQFCNKVSFEAGEDVVRHLISLEVLWDPTPVSLSFSHQTLADCLVVHSTLAKNKTLVEFILDHPQLPFIRPAVRAFFFFLRAHQVDTFRKQVWQVLSHNEIAYHVKRLICESMAEVVPAEDDWPLLRRIFQQQPDLFRRLLARIEEGSWFNFLKQYWLGEAQASENREDWLRQFCWKLGIWVNQYPTEVITLWREAITSQGTNRRNIIENIVRDLVKFEAWNAEGIPELLGRLVEFGGDEYSLLGKVLSRWVQSDNSGDDLLWKYITRNVSPEDASRLDIGNQLHCKPHKFHQENFLVERLKQSDELLNLALRSIECWSNSNTAEYKGNTLRTGFLWSTSWKLKHTQQDSYHADDLTILLMGLEKALKHRSHQNDAWWQKNEPHLRTTTDAALRYLAIQAYKESVQTNISGVESQLQDKVLFQWEELNHELGELMQVSYPCISKSAQATNQTVILSLVTDQPNYIEKYRLSSWIISVSREVYDLLIWIPPIFRTPEAQFHINDWQDEFGCSQPSPDISVWGGVVMPPLSVEALIKLSDESLFRLLRYYEQCPNRNPFDRDMIGGFREVVGVVREASSLHPERFLKVFSFIATNLDQDYLHAVVEGIANHLRYRFGSLSPSSGDTWKPVDPLLDEIALATTLIKLLEQYSVIWKNGKTVSHALQACCDVLDDSKSADRLTLLLFWVHSRVPDDEHVSISDSERELVSRAINSSRGVAAESAMTLCNRLLEKGQPLPELLPCLLHHFARDSAIYVRVPILKQLPFLMYKWPDLGWRLLDDVFHEPQPRLWQYAERCFYHQYRDHFLRVAPYLNRLMHEGMEEARDTWGRISALASLAGHISQEVLFDTLKTANADAWKGAAQVFVANLDRREHTVVCHSWLITALRHGCLPVEAIRQIENCFGKEENRGLIQRDLALAFLNAFSASTDGFDIHDFLDWLSHEARRNPLAALDVVEILAKKLETRKQLHQQLHIWEPQPLIATLNEILREADEIDNLGLIQRAINLQDRFLNLDIYGIEELFVSAGQNQ